MKFFIFILSLGFSFFASASNTSYILKSSEISYKVEFPLKTVIGKTSESKGKGVCEKNICEFLIAAPVKSFKSGDTNRDIHMQEATKAAKFPLISVSLVEINPEKLSAINVEIEFASVKKIVKNVQLIKSVTGNIIDVSTKFKILLSDFKIERPTLLGVAIDDEVEINVNTQWVNQ